MDLARFSIRHARAILFLTAVLCVAGVWAYVRTPTAIFPRMRFARIDVVASAGNLPPEQVRVTVAIPLERAFLGLPSVRRVVSTCAQGSAELVVEFDPHSDVQTDLQYVNAAIAQTRPQTPGAQSVIANVVVPESEPVLSYALVPHGFSQTLVHEYAQREIVPALYGTPGLARVLVAGGPEREYRVTLDPATLAVDGLTADDVASALARANDVAAVGIVQTASQRRSVLVDAKLQNAAALAAAVVTTKTGAAVPVGSLGQVRLGTAPPSLQVSYDAQHAVALNVYGLPGADSVRMAAEVKARLAALARRLPSGIGLHLYWDSTDIIVASQRSLRDAIAAGALLALGVIFFFLRDVRMTAVAALVIPAAMAIAIFAVSSFGETLNIMSVGGLAIAVGLIIDDAIVVIEGIARTQRDRPELDGSEAIVQTMRRLIGPMAASTLTTVVVFVPLALLGGVAGAFFRSLALTLSCALFVSLGLALFVTPILFRTLPARHRAHVEPPNVARALARYEPLLAWALRHRSAVYAGSAVVLVLTVALVATLPTGFLPHLDEGQFEIAYRMPVGTSLAASDAAAFAIERVVLADPAVVAEGRFTGIDTNGFSPTPARAGIVRVRLAPLGRRASFDA
ncbi:MAG TPA: efflux RND transporter permease subunit, partial [Candidatus Tumulicola sp.]|nr:efflux RND transporter permease subunit [Candidatus Tumulicola sp.]